MSRAGATFALAALLGLAAPALAQGRAGVYRVAGSEPGKGAYTGRVELRWIGGSYAFLREVEFSSWAPGGRGVSTVWTGRARDAAGGGVTVELQLERMGWVTEARGQALRRTAADGVPMPVQGSFVPQGGDLAGGYRGQGAPFADPSETWTWQAPPGGAPIWASERRLVPMHRSVGGLEKALLFLAFRSYHQTAWVAPYVSRPEFQAVMHFVTLDRTDFAWHRAHPGTLRLIDRLVDPLTLEEARAKADGFGRLLRDKAALADAEVPQRFLDPTGALCQRAGGIQVEDNDGALWSGGYAWSQALRYQVTGDPLARDTVERVATALAIQMEISGRPDEFARTIRAATGLPLGGNWVAGTGPYAGIEWKIGGNNDMGKGLYWGGLAAHEVLPAGHPLRPRYARALAALADQHPIFKGKRWKLAPSNETAARGVAALLGGDPAQRDRYRRLTLNPFLNLWNVIDAGGMRYLSVLDWSGTHLGWAGSIVQVRLAEHLGRSLYRRLLQVGMRRTESALRSYRRVLWSLAVAAYAQGGQAVDTSEFVWALREQPYPRIEGVGQGWVLRQDSCAGPIPKLPWKFDWTRDPGRSQTVVMPPIFEMGMGNYHWKDAPFPELRLRAADDAQSHSADFLIPYWLARSCGVLSPAD